MTPDAPGHKHPPCGGTEQMDILSLCQHLGQMSAVKFCITTFNQFPDLQLFLWAGGGCQLPISSSRKQTLTTGCMADSLSDISYICNLWSMEHRTEEHLIIIDSPKAKSKVPVGSWRPRWRRLRRYGPRCSSSPPAAPRFPTKRRRSPGSGAEARTTGRSSVSSSWRHRLKGGQGTDRNSRWLYWYKRNHRMGGSRTRGVCGVEWRPRARSRPNVQSL